MIQRLRGAGAQARNPSIRWGRLVLNVLWILAVIGLFILGVARHSSAPVTFNQAFSTGVRSVTFDHLTPGPVAEWSVVALLLASTRWIVLEFRAFLGGGIEVRPLDNATGDKVDTHPLDVAFRQYLTLPKLYQLTTIPGDPEPQHLIEVLRVPSAAGWRGLAAAAFSYAFPRRAFIVSASLRRQAGRPGYGVTVQVRRLPGLATELETQWSNSFERALQRGAYAAVAHILPQTRACRNAPWAAWRRRVLPVSLFRDYQRAKKMVAERRYDEALHLYHQALIKDANNVDLRYDVGQLYERLGLYPDALYTYLDLIEQIFPRPRQRQPHRVTSAQGKRDRFVIWYRYVVLLALGGPLASELLHPDWPELRRWLAQETFRRASPRGEERPLRTVELLEKRRLLADRLSDRYPQHTRPAGASLRDLLQAPCSDAEFPQRVTAVNRCLLQCAESEARSLEHAMSGPPGWFLRLLRPTSLTLTAVRQIHASVRYRLLLLNGAAAGNGNGAPELSPGDIDLALRRAGFSPEQSTSWLEHYNAACTYALVMRGDTQEMKKHLPFAFAAVSALEMALRYGEDIDFVRTKRYWLQAGDPDLAGLRHYKCFRAFEARVYGRPLPATVNIAKYELYLYLRAVLEDAAGHLELEWRRRAAGRPGALSHAEFEEWWRQELHAWELAIRLGRFYRQWQTRREAVESRRNWIESFGREAKSIPYPHVDPSVQGPDVGDFAAIQDTLRETESILSFLGHKCGSLIPSDKEAQTPNIMGRTREWSDYAARCSQSAGPANLMSAEVVAACEMRAAVWASLKHWARTPSRKQKARFADTVGRLERPPPAVPAPRQAGDATTSGGEDLARPRRPGG
jgi:hypothetical protein